MRRQRRLAIDRAQVLEPLVADAREALRLVRDDTAREADGLELLVRGLEAEEVEDAEDEAAAGLEMVRGAFDHAVEQRPAVQAAVVRGRLRIVAVAARRSRHLRRVRADEVE